LCYAFSMPLDAVADRDSRKLFRGGTTIQRHDFRA